MYNIVCLLNSNFRITNSNIISFSLENDNNNTLKASITITKSLYNQIINSNDDNNIECEILINDKEYFNGNIASVSIDNDLCNIRFISKQANPNQDAVITSNNIEDNLIEKFKLDNHKLFQRRNNYNNRKVLNNIEHNIIKDSLKINIDKLLPISELDLSISASWNRLFTGYCDLTNRIKNKLKNGLINTLTPNKLIKSWPKLFDRLITNSKGILKTKYFVTHSILEECNTNTITINNSNNNIVLNEIFFDFKLSVGWEYSQFITENLHCKIMNNIVKNNNKQVLNINLHNVQEYIEDIYGNFFFKSKLGNSIFNIIICEVKQFIINSMQNITVIFQVPIEILLSENLTINQLIKIGKYTVAINKIEILCIQNKNIATITCIGSEYDNAFTNTSISNILINNEYDNNNIIDVLENINIINTSDEQIKKINSIKDYKQVNDILNENATKLIITLKPIKTEHNKIKNIYVQDINLFM